MKLEWPTLGLIVLCYGTWAVAGFWIWPVVPILALALMALAAALHSSLVHECLHGHPTRKRLVNETLVTLPLSWVYPYRRYKATHLAHHHDEQLTDPLEDPESYYKARWQLAAARIWQPASVPSKLPGLGSPGRPAKGDSGDARVAQLVEHSFRKAVVTG